MRILLPFLAAALILPTFAPAADARPRDREQEAAFRAKKDGHILPLPEIEARVRSEMRGARYLGPEFDGRTYRLKFIREGRVIWVDVDARSGRIINRSGD